MAGSVVVATAAAVAEAVGSEAADWVVTDLGAADWVAGSAEEASSWRRSR